MQIAPTIDREQAEIVLAGQSVSPGLGMGPAWVVGDELSFAGAPRAIEQDEIAGELLRLQHSFEETLADLEKSAERIAAEFNATLGGIFRAHGEILRELFNSGEFERELRQSLVAAEAAVGKVLRRWHQTFEAIENQTIRQRADDVLDLGRNMIRRLRGVSESALESIPGGSVLVLPRLLPSDVVRMTKSHVMAVVVESLGLGSHAALLAREKGIPTITGIPGVMSRLTSGMELLVDGYRGTLVISPDASTRGDFEERLDKWQATLTRCKDFCREPARSIDGQWIRVDANIGIEDDVTTALDNGADGVGLLRIEQVYFARHLPPTEDELFADLKKLVSPLGDRRITIRLLDIGGDKPLPFLRLPTTSNPALGRRGVRVLLDYPQLVRTQMGAILRLSLEQRIRVLVPMITLVDDLRTMREAFEALAAEREINDLPEFGAMIETPAAALGVPALLKYADFLCIGTNDLAQYTLAAARDDAAVNEYYRDGHASVIRLLEIILADAKQCSVTLCGELAGQEEWVPRLLDMGFRTLSVAPTLIPTTKAAIRAVDIAASDRVVAIRRNPIS